MLLKQWRVGPRDATISMETRIPPAATGLLNAEACGNKRCDHAVARAGFCRLCE